MSDAVVPLVYVKSGCPWCEEVLEYFETHRLPFRKVVVTGNPAAFEEMIRISGQRRAPTMDWDGDILADFGVDELIPFLAGKGVVPG